MANVLLSPGVLSIENDQSFIRQQPVNVGASIIGPTVRGPIELPTIVTSYSDFTNRFGDVLVSGGNTYSYFTSIAAYNYFNNGGDTLLVTRVVSGSYTPAVSTTINNALVNTTASVNADFSYLHTEVVASGSSSLGVNGINIVVTGSSPSANTSTIIYVSSGSSAANTITAVITAFNTSASVSPYNTSLQNITSSVSASTGILFESINGITGNSYYYTSGSNTVYFTGGTNQAAFELETLSEGIIMNSSSSLSSGGALESGSVNNIRWQIINPITSSGQFTLLIRQGDDVANNPTVLETFINLSLDPQSPNYISKMIGDYKYNYNPSTNQIEVSGSYENASRYVRVKSVNYTTPSYFDNNGLFKSQYTSSIPLAQSGSFTGATGDIKGGSKFWNEIEETNTQGLVADNYANMINLLSNQDDYRFNLLLTPGLIDSFATHTSKISNIITNTQERGDNIYILDLVPYGSTAQSAITQALSRDTSYAASYWPWCQIIDPATGKRVWVPASTLIAGVYAFNDRVAEPWFAPAGINRGGLSLVVRVEQKLPQSTRDSLYQNKVNPIATFPGQGIVVYGQKTLQLKASALDRVNVRRLLISLKNYISQVGNTLVFQQNTIATRNQFLSQVNPYLESVQQRQGLYAFKVIMDDTNNTADVIDRNQLVGQIYIQPTRTAEFIYLTFNITPTGTQFP